MLIVDQDRKEMARLFCGVGVEVGVADGQFAEFILDNTPVTKLWGVDIYQPHEGYRDYTRGTTFNRMRRHAEETLKPFGDRHEFIFKFSMDAVKDFDDNSLDFVYIDANHDYEYVTEDIVEWSKKVKSGGIIAGDDYMRRRDPDMRYDVIRAVNDYVEAHDIELSIYTAGRTPTNWMFRK